jgi:ATP-dependent Clp protease protease subunit
MGYCASAAAIIFVSGHKRFMMPLSSVMIHKGSAQIAGDAQKVIDQADSYKKEIKKMRDFIADHTSIPSRTLSSKQNNDWEIDAEYCLEHKVCDVVVSTLDDII